MWLMLSWLRVWPLALIISYQVFNCSYSNNMALGSIFGVLLLPVLSYTPVITGLTPLRSALMMPRALLKYLTPSGYSSVISQGLFLATSSSTSSHNELFSLVGST